MRKVLAINGSYRDNGITDQAVNALIHAVEAAGAEVELVLLRDYPIEFCLNCRECTQQPDDMPGECVQQDGMQDLVDKIESADAFYSCCTDKLWLGYRHFQTFYGASDCVCLLVMGYECTQVSQTEDGDEKSYSYIIMCSPGNFRSMGLWHT